MARIVRTALNPVMLTPNSLFKARMLKDTVAIERSKERAVLSTAFFCLPLKNTSILAKPGIKNISVKPSIALMAAKPPETDNTEPTISSSAMIGFAIGIISSLLCSA